MVIYFSTHICMYVKCFIVSLVQWMMWNTKGSVWNDTVLIISCNEVVYFTYGFKYFCSLWSWLCMFLWLLVDSNIISSMITNTSWLKYCDDTLTVFVWSHIRIMYMHLWSRETCFMHDLIQDIMIGSLVFMIIVIRVDMYLLLIIGLHF